MTRRHTRQSQSGFALLLVFLMAAVIAITLYMQIPRVAFESQRQKEQLLMERGAQYKRAIQMFVSTNKRWPSKIEDLENFNNRRFLRKRYLDPMTGKDEWRIIHIANGMLTDSKLNKQNPNGQQQQQSSTAGQYVGEQAGIGQTLPGAGGAALAQRRRASDSSDPGVQGSGPGDMPPGQATPGVPQQPGVAVGQQGGLVQQYPPVQPGVGQPGVGQQYPPGVPQPGMPGVPGQVTPGQIIQGRMNPMQPGMTGGATSQQPGGSSYVGGGGSYVGGGYAIGSQPTSQVQPTQYYQQPGQQPYPGMPGAPVSSQTGGVSPQQYPTTPGSQGPVPAYMQPGVGMGAQSGAAQDMLNRALFGPRPGGPPQGIMGAGAVMGAGIAGFASNADSDSIMVYNDRTNYSEWEFVYDPAKAKQVPNPLTGGIGTPVTAMGTSTGSNPGTSPPNSTDPASLVGPARAIMGSADPGYNSAPQGNSGAPGAAAGTGTGSAPPVSGFGINPIRQ